MSTGDQLRKYRIAAGLTIGQAAKAEGVSKRLWEYWEKNEKLPPDEGDVLTRERLLARWESKANTARGAPTVPRDSCGRSGPSFPGVGRA
jgi:hypothetical protein